MKPKPQEAFSQRLAVKSLFVRLVSFEGYTVFSIGFIMDVPSGYCTDASPSST